MELPEDGAFPESLSRLAPPASWLLSTQEQLQGDGLSSAHCDAELHDAPTQVFETQELAADTRMSELLPETQAEGNLVTANTMIWLPDDFETQPIQDMPMCEAAVRPLKPVAAVCVDQKAAFRAVDNSLCEAAVRPIEAVAAICADQNDVFPTVVEAKEMPPSQRRAQPTGNAANASEQPATNNCQVGDEVAYLRFKQCILKALCTDGQALIDVPGIGQRLAAAGEWGHKGTECPKPRAGHGKNASAMTSAQKAPLAPKSPLSKRCKRSPGASPKASPKVPGIPNTGIGFGVKRIPGQQQQHQSGMERKSPAAGASQAGRTKTPRHQSKHARPTSSPSPTQVLADEDTTRKTLGHELQPVERGQRVAVVGDGWGGGQGGYEALITEADALTYTVVALTGEMRWKETHVLKVHCIELGDTPLGDEVPSTRRKSGGKRSKVERMKQEPAAITGGA